MAIHIGEYNKSKFNKYWTRLVITNESNDKKLLKIISY